MHKGCFGRSQRHPADRLPPDGRRHPRHVVISGLTRHRRLQITAEGWRAGAAAVGSAEPFGVAKVSEDQLFAYLSRIEANIAELRATTRADIADLSTTTRADIAELRGELHEGIAGLAKNVDIAALGRLVEQQRDDILSLKDDMSVLTAIVSRLDNSHTRLLTEIRATHAQVSRLTDRLGRFDDRVRRLEEERHL
jgi:hypothetical protein